MTIRRRLVLSFLVILLLFGLNLVIYFWGNHRRKVSVEALQRAVDRQVVTGERGVTTATGRDCRVNHPAG